MTKRATIDDARGRGRLLLCALAALAAFAAATALAPSARAAKNKVVVRDATQETSFLSRTPSMDVVRAVALRRGQTMVHRVRMRRKLRVNRRGERPSLFINTRGNGRSAAEYLVFGSRIYKLPKRGDPKPIGDARLRGKGRNWTIRFNRADLPVEKRYGWVVMTQRRNGNTADLAPPRRYAKSPR